MYLGESMAEESSNTSIQEMSTQPVNEVTAQLQPGASSLLSTTRRSKRRSTLSLAFVIALLLAILAPASIATGYGISAYQTYNALRDQAHSAVQHLFTVKTIFTG